MTRTPGGRRWRPRPRKFPEPDRRRPEPDRRPPEPDRRRPEPDRRPPGALGDDGPTAASAMLLAIGLLTASLDSPELEEWATWFLVPEEPEALATVIAGLHLVSLILLQQLEEAAGQPSASTLQKLAIAAAAGPQMPFTG